MIVLIREAAYADLDGIHATIAQDKPRAALQVIERILDGIERLALFPNMGGWVLRQARGSGSCAVCLMWSSTASTHLAMSSR